MIFYIPVSQDDIDRGVRRHARFCPVALAIIAGGFLSVEVTNCEAAINDGRVRLEPDVVTWIATFDLGLPVKPCTLLLDPISSRMDLTYD